MIDNTTIRVIRRRRYVNSLMKIFVEIKNEQGEVVSDFFLRNGKSSQLVLPKGVYYFTFYSNSFLLARRTEKILYVNATESNNIDIDLFISYVNTTAMIIPFLQYLVPVCEFSCNISYQKRESIIVNSKKKETLGFYIMALLTFLVLFLFCGTYGNLVLGNFNLPDIPEVWALKGTDRYTYYTYELLGMIIGSFLLPIILGILTIILFVICRKLKRKKPKKFENPVNLSTPFILYLRSFTADKETKKNPDVLLNPSQTEEKIIVSILESIAPVYAIGAPGEKNMPDGAYRIYVEHEAWQDKVKELAQSALLIVLRLGDTPGFRWEVNTCLDKIELKKLLFIMPKCKYFTPITQLYSALNQRNIDVQYLPIETGTRGKGSINGFLYFDELNEIKYSAIKTKKVASYFTTLKDNLRNSLADALSRFKVFHKNYNATLRVSIGVLLLIISLSISLINAWISYYDFNSNRFPKDLLCSVIEQVPEVETKDGSDYSKTRLALYGFRQGEYFVEPDRYMYFYQIETELYSVMNDREFEIIQQSGHYSPDYLILLKKYMLDEYYKEIIDYMTNSFIEYYDREKIAKLVVSDELSEMHENLVLELLPYGVNYDDLSLHKQHELDLRYRTNLIDLYYEGYDITPIIKNIYNMGNE